MRHITIYIEDFNGVSDEVTGIHVDNGDGTARWITGDDLDTMKPEGSPYTWRAIGLRIRDDSKAIPIITPKTPRSPADREVPL